MTVFERKRTVIFSPSLHINPFFATNLQINSLDHSLASHTACQYSKRKSFSLGERNKDVVDFLNEGLISAGSGRTQTVWLLLFLGT